MPAALRRPRRAFARLRTSRLALEPNPLVRDPVPAALRRPRHAFARLRTVAPCARTESARQGPCARGVAPSSTCVRTPSDVAPCARTESARQGPRARGVTRPAAACCRTPGSRRSPRRAFARRATPCSPGTGPGGGVGRKRPAQRGDAPGGLPAFHSGTPDEGVRADASGADGLGQLCRGERADALAVLHDVPGLDLGRRGRRRGSGRGRRSRSHRAGAAGATAGRRPLVGHRHAHPETHAGTRESTGRVLGRDGHRVTQLVLLEGAHVTDHAHARADVEGLLHLGGAPTR